MNQELRQSIASSLDHAGRSVRLISGLILTAFVVTHLSNLALGLVSLATMESWRHVLMAPWRTLPGAILLASTAAAHAILGLHSIARRRSSAISPTDLVQIALGIVTPPLLITHVLTMWVTSALFAKFDTSYGVILTVYWSFAPFYAFQQLFVVVVVWTHAAIGFYSWISPRAIWPRIRIFVLAVLFLVPIVALLGFAESGKEVLEKLANEQIWRDHVVASIALVQAAMPTLNRANAIIMFVYGAMVVIAFAFWFARSRSGRATQVQVNYDGGTVAMGKRGLSILEISLINNIPHAHICKGRGRCGTCRVDVRAGRENLSDPTALELQTLSSVGAAEVVRLACLAVALKGEIAVSRILPPYADLTAAQTPEIWARTQEIAVTAVESAQSPPEVVAHEQI